MLKMKIPMTCFETMDNSRQGRAEDARTVALSLPPRGVAYQWTPDEQILGYRERMKIDPVRVVGINRCNYISALPGVVHQVSPRWFFNNQSMDLDRYMELTRVSGLIMLKDGDVLLERYGLGRTANDCWDIQSVSKSVTSLLVGAAIQDGYIKSMDALVVDYIPELKGSVYDDVKLRNLMTMTAGVEWSEDASTSEMWLEPFVNGINPTVSYMRRQRRIDKLGGGFLYSTGDADLAGLVVIKAVGKSLSEYLSKKIWIPYGMEKEAYWMVDSSGSERGGGCLSVCLRDLARLGQFVLEGGKAGGIQVLPQQWLAEATSVQVPLPPGESGDSGRIGYGYLWWIYKEAYAALGHAGQAIYVYPKDRVVIALNSAWLEPNQTDLPNYYNYYQARESLICALHASASEYR